MNYLYNGVGPLPDIYSVYTPELQAQFPHAYVAVHENTGEYYLLLDDTPKTTTAPMFSDAAFVNVGESWEKAEARALYRKVIWCNTDIVGDDGTIYLAASEPVPVTARNPAAMLNGFLAGAAIRRMRGMKQPEQPPVQTIVGYRYNGVGPLPDVNGAYEALAEQAGVDVATAKEALPYYFLLDEGGGYSMRLVDSVPYINAEGYLTLRPTGMYIFGAIDGAWVYVNVISISADTPTGFNSVLWTSHDILNADGSTYLAATEPVPVYE